MINQKKYPMALVLAIAMLITMLGGCASSATASSGPKEVTVYAAFPDYELPTYFNAFEKETGIKVNYVRLSTGEMLARIEAEKNNPNASVMYGGGIDNYYAADRQGLLEPYQSPELNNVPDQYKDAKKVYNPISYGVIAFVCNKEWFEGKNMPYPTSWQDLLKPEFKGQISISHPATAGTGYACLATVIQLMGEDEGWVYYQKLSKNVRQWTRAGTAPASEVGLGEAAIGIVYAHGALAVASEGYPLVLSYPKEGTSCEIAAVALIKKGIAGEEENARRLVDFLISKRGQELYIDSKSYRSPVNVTAKATPGLPTSENLVLIDYDFQWAAENMERLNEKFIKMINDTKNLKK